MNRKKVQFRNEEGHDLTGYVELPLNREPHNFVLFAHCFTCNKNFFAAKNISNALTKRGYGVMRFDFTGLGESEGEFSETNFSGNVEDLLAAAGFLEKDYKAPALLVGHSLGGAAVIFAAQQLQTVKAVAVIGAPSDVKHVTHLLKSGLDEIQQKGQATVDLGGRDFLIKAQFLQDLKKSNLQEVVQDLDRALMILHSPQDFTVGVDNAEEIYTAARHPKSYVSLDGADHLLTDSRDSHYAGEVISAWATRYLPMPEPTALNSKHQVVANLGDEGYHTQLKAGKHYFISDEPVKMGGNDYGPTPYEYISGALAACTSMTLQMYARRKEWPLENVETHVSYSRTHAMDCQDCENDDAKIDTFERYILMEGALDEKQQQRLLQIADRCPVHRTLTSHTIIRTQTKFEAKNNP